MGLIIQLIRPFFDNIERELNTMKNNPRFNHTAASYFQLILSELFHSSEITDTIKTIDLSRRINTYRILNKTCLVQSIINNTIMV